MQFIRTFATSGEPTLGYTTNRYFHVKANSLALTDNDPVGTWADQSGNGRDLIQSTAGNKPLYKTNIINGYPSVRFDGTDDYMDVDFSPDLAIPYSLFMVFAFVASPSGTRVIYSSINSDYHYARVDAAPSYIYNGTQLNATAGINNTSFHYILHKWNTSSSDHRLDAASNTGTTSNVALPGLRVAEYYASLGTYTSNIQVAEIIIYSEAISNANRDTVESYITTKYAL